MTSSSPMSALKVLKKVMKTEDEKSLRGTVSLFKNAKTGMIVYIRGKKIFVRQSKTAPAREIDTIEAGYLVRREYAEKVSDGLKEFVSIHPKLAKCKWGAEASLKLDRMVFKK